MTSELSSVIISVTWGSCSAKHLMCCGHKNPVNHLILENFCPDSPWRYFPLLGTIPREFFFYFGAVWNSLNRLQP